MNEGRKEGRKEGTSERTNERKETIITFGFCLTDLYFRKPPQMRPDPRRETFGITGAGCLTV